MVWHVLAQGLQVWLGKHHRRDKDRVKDLYLDVCLDSVLSNSVACFSAEKKYKFCG